MGLAPARKAAARVPAPAPAHRAPKPALAPARKGDARVAPLVHKKHAPHETAHDKHAAPAKNEKGEGKEPGKKPGLLHAVITRIHAAAKKAAHHAAPAVKVSEARSAARAPANDRASRAKAGHAEVMQHAETPKPEKNAFLELLRAKLAEVAPKNLDEIDKFKSSGKAAGMKADLSSQVAGQKDASTGDLRTKASVEPDASAVEAKVVEPLAAAEAVAPPEAVHAADAVPERQPDAAVSLSASSASVDTQLKANKITDEQLVRANDPRFAAVVSAKDAVHANAAAAPAAFRAEEQALRADTRANATRSEAVGMPGMATVRTRASTGVRGRQESAKTGDEAARKAVADHIELIFAETKTAVQAKLASLDGDVSALFDGGESRARQRMEDHVNQRKDAYKADRYSGLDGKARWVWDLFADLPDEVKVFYDEGRAIYLADMDAVIVRVAALVETRLAEAKGAVVEGRGRIAKYVESLPKDLQREAHELETAVQARFTELEQGVDAKRDQLADAITQKYQEARDKADAKLAEMRASDKGLVSRFADALGPVLRILLDFRNKVMALVKEAMDVIDLIVGDPIGFLGNLLSAVKQGVKQFATNIWTHLKEGLFGWLFGALAGAGIKLPKDFSLKSIFGLVLQVLGITYDNMRKKAVKLIGERNVALLEKVWAFVSALIQGGIEGLWEHIKEYLSDLKDTVIEGIKEWVVTKIVTAAITKLVSMFNPVGAIIQAIITIYNVVQFFIERINQIIDFVQAIVTSVGKIARGQIADAANWIESAMAKAIPVLISFLAGLLGLGGIADKIRAVIEKVQAKVDAAIDKAIAKIVSAVSKLFAGGKQKAGQATPARTPEAQAKWDQAVAGVHADIAKMEEAGTSREQVKERIPEWKKRWGFRSLSLVGSDDDLELDGEMNPAGKVAVIKSKKPPTPVSHPVQYASPDSYLGGRGMIAPVVTSKPNVAGSKPSVAPTVWANVNLRRHGHRLYVLGHLFNMKLGGRGDLVENLTPITFSANAKHNARVESKIKEGVKKGNWYHYELTVDFPKPAVAVKNWSPRAPKAGEQFHPDEGKLATSFSATWWELKQTPKAQEFDEKPGTKQGPVLIENVPEWPQLP